MPKMSIRQFRAALASRSEQGAVIRAYRALTRRPGEVSGMVFGEWVTWPPAAAPATRA